MRRDDLPGRTWRRNPRPLEPTLSIKRSLVNHAGDSLSRAALLTSFILIIMLRYVGSRHIRCERDIVAVHIFIYVVDVKFGFL